MLPTVQFGQQQQQSYQEKPKSSPRNPHRLSPHKCFALISRRPALCPRTAVKSYDRRPLLPRARNHIKNCLKAGKRRGAAGIRTTDVIPLSASSQCTYRAVPRSWLPVLNCVCRSPKSISC